MANAFVFDPSDSQLREFLFKSHPSYDTEKANACYEIWATGGLPFQRCLPNCGCPRQRLISQAEVDAERVRRTNLLYSQVLSLLRNIWNNGSPLDPPPQKLDNQLTMALARLMTISPQGAELAQPCNLGAAMGSFERVVYQ